MHNLLLKIKSRKQKKIKVYLYANSQCIKKIRVYEGENIFDNSYVINVLFKKHLFGTNLTKIVVKPVRMLKNTRNEVHVIIDYERGVEL